MKGRVVTGIILILVGIGFLLDQFAIISLKQLVATWWPVILIIIGLIQFFNRMNSSFITGLVFVAVGTVFLMYTLFSVNVFKIAFPVIIIVVGIALIFTKQDKQEEKVQRMSNEVDTFAFFGEVHVASKGTVYTNRSVGALFGSAKIDLRETKFDADATIEVTAIFGTVTIIVPPHIDIKFSGVPIFGSFEDRTNSRAENMTNVTLLCRSTVVFGTVEVIQ